MSTTAAKAKKAATEAKKAAKEAAIEVKEAAKRTATKTKEKAAAAKAAAVGSPVTTGLIFLGVGLATYAVFKLAKNTGNAIDNIFDPDIDNNVAGTGGSTQGATITPQAATNYAQQLLDAMNYNPCWLCYGTDEDAILAVFKKLVTPADFLLVFNIFGMKDYNGYNSPPDNILANIDSYKKRDLVYWLREELEPSDGEVYDLVKSKVEQAGFAW